jgi:hypothetical protein
MTDVLDSKILDWVANFTGVPRASLEDGGSTAERAASGGANDGAPGGPRGGSAHGAKKMEAETASGDMREFEERFRRVTGQIIHTVEINALLLSSGIEAACIDFKKFTDGKIDKIKEHEEIDKLANEVLEVVATAVSGGFAAVMIEGEIAKEVFKTLAETTLTVVKAKAEPNTSAGFEKFVESMIAGAKQAGHDAGTKAIEIVRGAVVAAEKAYDKARNEGVSLSTSKEYSFVEPFLFAESSHFDALITRYCGVPTPSMVNKLQIKMTGDMIKQFAEKYVRAREDGVYNAVVDDAPYLAHETAQNAMQLLKKQHGFHYQD